MSGRLLFNDEFNSFDAYSKADGWRTAYHWGAGTPINGETGYYVDTESDGTAGPAGAVNPFSVSDGILTITSAPKSGLPNGQTYASGVISSMGSFERQYGYYEIRADMPGGKGFWPAFWLMPADRASPPELDIMEFASVRPNEYVTTAHSNAGGYRMSQLFTYGLPDLSNGFHTYGADWQADRITWYFDDRQVYSIATPGDFHKPMYMLLNQAVGGGAWIGPPDGSTQSFNIDYVRVYDSRPGSGTAPPAPPPVTGDGGGGGSSGGGGGGTTDGGSPAVPTPQPASPTAATSGDDSLTGTGGDDAVRGGLGNDQVFGDLGNDELYGEAGADTLHGGAGTDMVHGGADNDLVRGGAGDDAVHGGGGDDQAYGDRGADLVYGNLGNDWIHGGSESDTVHGGAGVDTIAGGGGADSIRGGADNDLLSGDLGDDRIFGDRGDDTLTGGGGADLFAFEFGSGLDVITDFNAGEGDRLGLVGGYSVSAGTGGAVLTLSSGGTLVLSGIDAGSVGDSWFVPL